MNGKMFTKGVEYSGHEVRVCRIPEYAHVRTSAFVVVVNAYCILECPPVCFALLCSTVALFDSS